MFVVVLIEQLSLSEGLMKYYSLYTVLINATDSCSSDKYTLIKSEWKEYELQACIDFKSR
jgi:hypothetical protein